MSPYWWGAPPYQINTRARGLTSQQGQNVISNQIMTAVHTPLLGTLYRKDISNKTEHNIESRAGISGYSGGGDTLHTQGYDTNMRKLQQYHGSPKFVSSISLDKTPSVVGGRVEMFGNIADMICQWEGMEEEEGESKANYLSTVTGIVIASTDRPGWKSSQASGLGKESAKLARINPDVSEGGSGQSMSVAPLSVTESFNISPVCLSKCMV